MIVCKGFSKLNSLSIQSDKRVECRTLKSKKTITAEYYCSLMSSKTNAD